MVINLQKECDLARRMFSGSGSSGKGWNLEFSKAMSLERWGGKVEKEEQVKWVSVILGIEVRKRLD